MIIARREHFYAALPKGPVTDEHFLIIPNKHIAHSLELDSAQEDDFNLLK